MHFPQVVSHLPGLQMVNGRRRPFAPSLALVTFASPEEAARARARLEGLHLGEARLGADLLHQYYFQFAPYFRGLPSNRGFWAKKQQFAPYLPPIFL